MTIRPWIDRAGAYPVVRTPCPCFAGEPALLDVPRAGVLHTTEGGWTGSMDVFKVHFAPHFIVGLNAAKRPEVAQLVPVGTIGAALVSHNNQALVQVEVVGFSREVPWIFDDATLDALASLMAVCKAEYGIPLTRPWPDDVWGLAGRTAHRNDGHFGRTAGWFGHGDCPSPDTHWDPGHLRWSTVFAHAEAVATTLAPTTAAVA